MPRQLRRPVSSFARDRVLGVWPSRSRDRRDLRSLSFGSFAALGLNPGLAKKLRVAVMRALVQTSINLAWCFL